MHSVSRLSSSLGYLLGAAALIAASIAMLDGCGADAAPGGAGGNGGTGGTAPVTVKVTPPTDGEAYANLSQWHFFADAAVQKPAADLVPYEVISPLFSDYTTKFRFVYLPDGQKMTYSPDQVFDFPVGSLLVKTFSYRADLRDPSSALRLLETRVLWRQADGWSVHTYVWNDDQSDAVSEVAGQTIPSQFIDAGGNTVANDYRVPNTNECKQCHTNSEVVGPLGPKSRQLDRDLDHGDGAQNQIDWFTAHGMLDGAPAASDRVALVDPLGDGPIDLRARSFLDANCSSCHTHGGSASQSALLLDFLSTDPANTPANWGVCKNPTSAGGAKCGHTFDVVPGSPDDSIMICRLTSTEAKSRMPPLGVQLVYTEGVELIRSWIAQLPAGSCNEPQ